MVYAPKKKEIEINSKKRCTTLDALVKDSNLDVFSKSITNTSKS